MAARYGTSPGDTDGGDGEALCMVFHPQDAAHVWIRRAALVDFLNFYNYERPHSALDHRPPATRVPMSAYRLTAEGITVPDIPERPLQRSLDDLTA